MEFTVKSGQPEKQRTACLIACVYEPARLSPVAEKIDTASKGAIAKLLRNKDFAPKIGQVLLLHHLPQTIADRVLLVGCGKEAELTETQFREIITKIIITLND